MAPTTSPRTPQVIRLVSWNVRALRDDRAAVVRTVRRIGPDVLCLQEAPRFPGWRWRCAALARDARLLHAGGGGTSGGVAVLAAVGADVREVEEHRLTHTRGLHRRGVVTATLRTGTGSVAIAAVHLGLDAAERERHAEEIDALLAVRGAPGTVLAGDLNETPRGPVFRRWSAVRQDSALVAEQALPTFPTLSARRRIDAVLTTGTVRVLQHQVLDDPDVRAASDHRPVVVDLVVDPG